MRSTLLPRLIFAALASVACPQASRAADNATPAEHRKFTYVIVHGAWAGGWEFKKVGDLLLADGHTVYRPTLTGQGERVHLASPDIDLNLHIQDIVNVILWEDLHDVVLVGHSYGGMVITGVADRVPERIKQVIYLDAFLPENGESLNTALGREGRQLPAVDGFVSLGNNAENKPPPHVVKQSAKTFSQPIELHNQEVAQKLPTTYVLTVDEGRQPEQDTFYGFYKRAEARGWKVMTIESDHVVHLSHTKELVELLERIP
jgi:pimeloyl-ACP methyl ester carboxylesterase